MADWDTSSPGDSDIVSQFPQNERAARTAVETNFGVDHHEANDADVGKHEVVSLLAQTSPSGAAGEGKLYGKDVGSGVIELHYTDEAGNEIQLTKGSGLDAFLTGVDTASAARTALGLGTAAVEADTKYNHRSNNLSDVASAGTARSNLGAAAAATTLTAGNGLSGGGSLAANRSFAVNTGNGITISSDDVAMSGSYSGTFTATEVRATSDRRLKAEICLIENPLEMVRAMGGRRYWRTDLEQHQFGVIAQDHARVQPEAVGEDRVSGYLGVSYNQIVPVLIEAVKTLAQRVDDLERGS